MKIRLKDIGGEYCTQRTSPAISKVRDLIEEALLRGESVEVELAGVKILTPSFIDELIPPLAIQYGEDTVRRLVTFLPPLTGFVAEQIERGIRLRRSHGSLPS